MTGGLAQNEQQVPPVVHSVFSNLLFLNNFKGQLPELIDFEVIACRAKFTCDDHMSLIADDLINFLPAQADDGFCTTVL